MKAFTRLLVWCFLITAPLLGFASDLNAYHIFIQDDLGGGGDTANLGYTTIYTPDFGSNVPVNSELDEVYLRITFNPGITPSIDLLYNIGCGNEHQFAPGGDAIKYTVSGQNLYVWYGFQDRLTSPVITTDSKWTFQVSGSDPVVSVDFFVSYHSRTSGSMPDLEDLSDFQKLSVLSVAQISDIQKEKPEAPMSAGGDYATLVSSGQKIIVLVHGWNPEGNVNHYADPASWQNLETNLLLCPVVATKGWVVTRYDWAADASTGPFYMPACADASRDAAAAHGRKLGKALAAKAPAQVLFIAHSAGNWAAKRAAAHLKWKYPGIKIQITSLDPFVHDSQDTMDLTPNFEIMSQWTDYRDNYYVYDKWGDSDILGWTSGNFTGWKNRQLELGSPLYLDWMLDHKGPIAWYGRTVNALGHINQHEAKDLLNFDIGYVYSLPVRGASPNDDCSDAEQLTGLTGDRTWFNYRATSQANEPAWSDGVNNHYPEHTVWGSWTPASSGLATFRCDGSDMENAAGTACVTPAIAVYTGTPFTSFTRVTNNIPSQAWVTFPAVAGTKYYIVIDGPYESGAGNAVGKIPLEWSMENAPVSTVSITAPSSGFTVSNTVAVAATASGATKVEFYLDGVLKSTDYATPFTWSWNTLTAANRDHALVAKSYDGPQLIDSSPSVIVTVNNSITLPPVVVPDDYEPNNSSLTAYGPLSSGTTLTARIDSPTDADWFKATISETGVIHLALTVPTGNDYDLELFSPTGAWVAGSYNKAGVNESLDYAATALGTYIFRVYGWPVGNGSYNTNTPYSLVYAFTAGSSTSYTLSAASVHGLVTGSPLMDAYPSGSTVTVTANPSPGYQFNGWSGDLSGAVNPTTLAMISNRFITANFIASTSTVGSITVSIQPPEAVAAGAQWKLTTESGWHNSGTVISGLVFGAYTVQYNTPSVWYPPANRSVNLSAANPTATINDSFIQQSADPLDTWTWRNPLPQGQDLSGIAYGNGLYVAVGPGRPRGLISWGGHVSGSIVTSTDGISWTYLDSGSTNRLVAITYGNGLFVAVGDRGVIVTSSNGITWAIRSSNTTNILNSVTYGNGLFVAVGYLNNTGVVVTSPDGVMWTIQYSRVPGGVWCVTYGNGQFLAMGGGLWNGTNYGNNVYLSSNGITWIGRSTGSPNGATCVTYGNGLYVAAWGTYGWGCEIYTSSDGASWTSRFSTWWPFNSASLFAITYRNGLFVAVGGGVIATSSDGITWSGQFATSGSRGVTCGDDLIVAVGQYGALYTSPDGGTWTNRRDDQTTNLNLLAVTYGNGLFVAGGGNRAANPTGAIMTSDDGITWTVRNSEITRSIVDVTYGNGLFVAVGPHGTNMISSDGTTWTARSTGTNYILRSVIYECGLFVALGPSGTIITSDDGLTWTSRVSGTTWNLSEVSYGNGQFVAVGYSYNNDGVVVTSPDGIVWTSHVIEPWLKGVTYGNGLYVALLYGQGGSLATSLNGTVWTIRNVGLSDTVIHVAFGNGHFVAMGQYGSFYTSTDGVTWTIRRYGNEGSSEEPRDMTYGNGQFVAVGGSTILQSGAVPQSQLTMPPDILVQPVDQKTVLVGGVTYSILAVGAQPLFFQWLTNGVPVPGQVSSSLTLNNVGIAHSGDYSVLVSNAFGVVTSDVATLTVLLPPTIVVPPQNRTVNLGETVTLNVVVNGVAPFSYQWRHNGVALAGVNGDKLRLDGVHASDAGIYTVVVSSPGGSVESAQASLVSLTLDGFSVTSSCSTINIVGYTGSGGAVFIPGTIDGLPVTTIGDGTFSGCTSLINVTIPNSVTSIGRQAFYNCTGLTSVTIPNSVTSIGGWAFCSCTGLTSVTIPNSITSIGEAAFSACTSLTAIDVSPSNPVYSSVDGVLLNNDLTTLITCPAGKIGCYAIPSSVTTIGDYAFFKCIRLTSVTIPNSVTSIGYDAFPRCDSLTSITIPASVTRIGDYAFFCCYSLGGVYFQGNAPNLEGSGVFFNDNNATVYYLLGTTGWTNPWGGRPSVLMSPPEILVQPADQSVPEFGNASFSVTCSGALLSYCWLQNGVVIPGQVNSSLNLNNVDIGQAGDYRVVVSNALGVVTSDVATLTVLPPQEFNYTSNNGKITITGYIGSGGAVTIPSMIDGLPVTSIGDWAFADCFPLTSITIPNSVTNIGDYAFYSCTNLTSVTIPASVTSIGNGAFAYCTSLTSVTIPDSVTNIGYWAFGDCTRLTAIDVSSSNPVYSSVDGVLLNNDLTTLITCPAGKIGGYAIPSSVTNIGNDAFASCTSLTSVTIPDSVTSIGDGAFYSCTNLTSVTIPNSVTSIGGWAFYSCTSLTAIDVSSSNPVYSSLEGVLFNDDLTTLITFPAGKIGGYAIPASVTTIGEWAFEGCTILTSVTVGNSVTSIGWATFSSCTSLTNVAIGNNVTNIGAFAFSFCTGLTSMMIGNSVTNIGDYAFYSCTSLTSVTIPDSVTTIGDDAFSYCTSLQRVYFAGNAPTLGSGVFNSCPATIYYLPAYASAWPATFDGSPTKLWNPAFTNLTLSSGAFSCTVTGSPPIPIALEATTNCLTGPWLRLQTTNLNDTSLILQDFDSTNHPLRFYRISGP